MKVSIAILIAVLGEVGHAAAVGAVLLGKRLSIRTRSLVVVMAAAPATPARLARTCGTGSLTPALVRLHTAADGFGGHTRADFNVGLFDDKAALDGPTAATANLGRQHPLAVRLGEGGDGNHADAAGVVAAVTRAEADAPSGLLEVCQLQFRLLPVKHVDVLTLSCKRLGP
jgi:hypothetical protein